MIGIIGDLIRVPREYETAIEIALGQSIHNIVTHTDNDAKDLIDYLKNEKKGRATFLPVSTIKSRILEESQIKAAKAGKGFVGIASDLISHDESLRDIFGNLLGKIVIVDTLTNALDIARSSGFSFRLVSLDGEQIRELEAQSKETERNGIDIARETKSLDDRIRSLSVQRVKTESELFALLEENKRLNNRLGNTEKELESISSKRLSAFGDLEEITQTISEHEKEINLLRASLEQSDSDQKDIQNQLDDMRSDISDLRISVESISISLAGAIEINDILIREKNGFSDGLKRIVSEREQARMEIDSLNHEEEEKSRLRDELSVEMDIIDSRVKQWIIDKEEIEQQLSGFIDRLSHATSRLSSFQTEQAKTDAKRERYALELDELKNRLWEEHEITYDNAQSFRLEIDSVQTIQKRLNELKNELREIGPVNANAIDEYTRVNERYEFMTGQKADIEKAMVDLKSIINSLVEEMRSLFLTHFAMINENFNAVFSDLFNGGTAEIILEEGEDVLSCNIDIRAQPPGKRLQSISLLSGGERCLTAIAILFAILQLRPSPFCVLDEVEAALDDVNIGRFTDFVKRYTAKSQFILVTHRKGTMEACDRMYGVTMQERGISKILSMRLDNS